MQTFLRNSIFRATWQERKNPQTNEDEFTLSFNRIKKRKKVENDVLKKQMLSLSAAAAGRGARMNESCS